METGSTKEILKLSCTSFRCPLAMQAGCLKIAPLSALLTSLKELSWTSSHEAQRWLDDGYQGESIPLSQQHLGVITPVTEKQEDLIFIIFSLGSVVLFVDQLVQYSAELKRVCTPFWAVILFWLIIRNKGKASQRSQQPEPNHRDIWGWHSYQTWHIMVLLLCMLIGWLTGGGDGGDIITGYKAATHLTAGGRFPAIFPQEVRPSLPFFCEQNQLLCTVSQTISSCFFVVTKPDVSKETWGHIQPFLWRPKPMFQMKLTHL